MPTKEEIDEWLKGIKKKRGWLAEQCGVSVNTVYDWFSKTGKIPLAKLLVIKSMMESSKGDSNGSQSVSSPRKGVVAVAVMYSADEWDHLLIAAEKTGLTPEELIRRAALGMYDDE